MILQALIGKINLDFRAGFKFYKASFKLSV